jgi:hypothetical protein
MMSVWLTHATNAGVYCIKEAKRMAEPTPYAKSVSTIKAIEKASLRDSVFGAFFGAFVGDACAVSAEKIQSAALTKEQVDKAMKIGGGIKLPGSKSILGAG